MRRLLLLLTVCALALPIGILVILAVAELLETMGDASGALVLNRIALAGGIVWALDLVFLVVAQSIHALMPSDKPPDNV